MTVKTHLQPRVVFFAQIHIIPHYGAFGGLPGFVAGNNFLCAVGVLNQDLGFEARSPRLLHVAEVELPKQPQRQRIPPAVAQHHTQRILAFFEQWRDVVSAVWHLFSVGREARFEYIIANFDIVQKRLVIAQTRNIKPRRKQFFVNVQLLSEQRHWVFLVKIFVALKLFLAVVNPLRLPVGGLKQGGFKSSHAAPRRGRAVGIIYLYTPIIFSTRFERNALVCNV